MAPAYCRDVEVMVVTCEVTQFLTYYSCSAVHFDTGEDYLSAMQFKPMPCPRVTQCGQYLFGGEKFRIYRMVDSYGFEKLGRFFGHELIVVDTGDCGFSSKPVCHRAGRDVGRLKRCDGNEKIGFACLCGLKGFY